MFRNLILALGILSCAALADLLELRASNAVIDGDGIAYEGREGRDCIGSWENERAEFWWDVELKKAGQIDISVIQAAMSVSAGNRYSVSIGGKPVEGVVLDTGDWGAFATVKLGSVAVEGAGRRRIVVRALSKKDRAVMNLRAVVLEGEAIEGAVRYIPPQERRGVYFSKKEYVPEELPSFADCRSLLPHPIIDGRPDYLEMYWKCWEFAFEHYKKPQPGSGFVSNYLDEAFNPNIFQWDTIFMIMFARYGNHVFPAVQSLDNFYCKQHSNGFICREIWEDSGKDHHLEQSPEAINPPLFSWAEMENFRVTGDKRRLEIVVPVLEKYVEWLETGRRKPGTAHGLYWSNSLGSGMDNTPRSGSGWADMSAQMVIQYNDLSAMCRQLGREEKADDFSSRAAEIGRKINQWMWNEADGLYYDVDDEGKQIKWKTAGCFWPMLAGITSKEQEAALITNLKDPDTFWRKNVFPALAADQQHYDPSGGYWLGGVWAPTNYAIIRGLTVRGYEEFAVEATTRYLDSMYEVYKDTGTVWELYAPDFDRRGSGHLGEKGDHHARPDFVGWTGCGPIALLIENIVGFRPDGQHNKLTWNLTRTDRHGIEQLSFGDVTASLICEKRSDKTQSPVINIEAEHGFELSVLWDGGCEIFHVKKGYSTLKLR